MKSDTNLSRRRLLARIRAVAAAAVPATAVALPGLPTGVPDYLDGQTVRGLTEALRHLEGLPAGEANKVLTAITEVLECSMANHAHDAPLLALKPEFDAAFEDWWSREEDRKRGLRRAIPHGPMKRSTLRLTSCTSCSTKSYSTTQSPEKV
jgi:hypothetical protein